MPLDPAKGHSPSGLPGAFTASFVVYISFRGILLVCFFLNYKFKFVKVFSFSFSFLCYFLFSFSFFFTKKKEKEKRK